MGIWHIDGRHPILGLVSACLEVADSRWEIYFSADATMSWKRLDEKMTEPLLFSKKN